MREEEAWWFSWRQYEEPRRLPDLEATTLTLIKYILAEEEPVLDGYFIERDFYAIQAALNGDKECTCSQRIKCTLHNDKIRIRRRERLNRANTNSTDKHLQQ